MRRNEKKEEEGKKGKKEGTMHVVWLSCDSSGIIYLEFGVRALSSIHWIIAGLKTDFFVFIWMQLKSHRAGDTSSSQLLAFFFHSVTREAQSLMFYMLVLL